MIDLRHTRAGLLAAIEAPDPAGEPFSDIADPRVATVHVRVHMRGHSRDDLFPILELALCERFAAVPRAYPLETCRPSDPGLDLGGFAADLLCFTLADAGDGAYRTGEHVFLATYNANAQHPMEERDLPFYVGLALCQRLQRAELRTGDQAVQLLAALEVALQPATIGRGGIGVTR